MTNLTVGIIGCGRMGRARARCAQYEASAVQSLDDLLECDAVFLCTPPDARPDQALRFASGALGTILYSCEATPMDIGARVFTSEGSVAFATWDFTLVENTIDGVLPEPRTEDIYLLETRGVLDAVCSGCANTIRCDWSNLGISELGVDRRPAASEIFRLVADNTRAKAELGWTPSVTMEQGLRSPPSLPA